MHCCPLRLRSSVVLTVRSLVRRSTISGFPVARRLVITVLGWSITAFTRLPVTRSRVASVRSLIRPATRLATLACANLCRVHVPRTLQLAVRAVLAMRAMRKRMGSAARLIHALTPTLMKRAAHVFRIPAPPIRFASMACVFLTPTHALVASPRLTGSAPLRISVRRINRRSSTSVPACLLRCVRVGVCSLGLTPCRVRVALALAPIFRPALSAMAAPIRTPQSLLQALRMVAATLGAILGVAQAAILVAIRVVAWAVRAAAVATSPARPRAPMGVALRASTNRAALATRTRLQPKTLDLMAVVRRTTARSVISALAISPRPVQVLTLARMASVLPASTNLAIIATRINPLLPALQVRCSLATVRPV